jgi:DNA-binding transcriptional MocR family regulator
MQNWWSTVPDQRGPTYAAIVAALDQAIRSGRLRPGERLPPQRDLAAALAVNLSTVTRAYGLAQEAGLIEGAGRLGSYVRNGADLPHQDISHDPGMIMPPQPSSALLAEAQRTGLTKLLRAGGHSPLLQYQPDGGSLRDRREAAAAFAARGIPANADRIIITAGGQNALHAIMGTVLAAGDTLCAGSAVYPGMLALAARFGLRVAPLPIDAGGIDPDALDRAARQGAKALYVVPTNDNPTTATMPIERRLSVAAITRRHGLTIVEDDAYGQLPAAPLPPFAALAPELTWHIASVSKIISPALRVAHVLAPSAETAQQLAADIHETAVMPPPLNAALVTLWLRDGSFGTLVAAVRREGMARQHIARRHLTGLDYAADPEGYHIWLRLPADADPGTLATMLRPAGLAIAPGESFAADPHKPPHAVRISLGGAIGHERLASAVEELGRRVREAAR